MIANKYNRPIYCLNGKNIKKTDFTYLISEIPKNSILTIDDADLIFSDCNRDSDKKLEGEKEEVSDDGDKHNNLGLFGISKKSISKKDLLQEMLSVFDGYTNLNDVIIIMTTNKITDFDTALIRPGRFDHIYTINNATCEQICDIYKYFMNKNVEESQIKKELIGLSVAEILHKYVIPNIDELDEYLLEKNKDVNIVN